jgi:hypothetical protein
MAWTNRADNIRQRDWTEIADCWARFGAGFDTSQYSNSSLEQIAETAVTAHSLAGNNIQIVALDDQTAFLSDLVFSQMKANHALVCAAQRIANGNPSWGVTDAYHASLLLMRSILSALGVFICRAHNRSIVVDSFPWMGRLDDKKKFKRRYANWQRCAAFISSTSKDFSQSDLYSVFQRVLKVSVVPPSLWPEVVVQNILQTSKTHFSASRNQLIYGSRFWFNLNDLLGECLATNWVSQAQRDMVAYTFAKDENENEIDCYCDCWILYLLSLRLHKTIYSSLTDTLDIFGYVEARRPEFFLVERQFASQI